MIDPDYFERKRRELGMDRQDTLASVQAILDEWYPGAVRAKQLHRGILRLVAPSASVAGALRMRQIELLTRVRKLPGDGTSLEKIVITIGQM